MSSVPLSGLVVGVAEKGFKLGIFSTINESSQLQFGVHYLDTSTSDFNYKEISPLEAYSLGVNVSYDYFFGSASENGFFVRGGLDFQRLSASTFVDLESIRYKQDGLELTCKTCGKISLESSRNAIEFIPSFGIGWQHLVQDNIIFQFFVGAQYYDFPSFSLNTNRFLPGYVKKEAKSIAKRLDSGFDEFGSLIPAASVTMKYHF